MRRFLRSAYWAPGVLVLLVVSCGGDGAEVETVIDDLSQPRGIAVGGSTICVAEAGALEPDGPTRERPGQLEADTGRVLCVADDGEPDVLLDELPFVYYPDAAVTSGVADVLLDGDRSYALVGESYGPLARQVLSFDAEGRRTVADLLAFAETSRAGDGATLSNPYSFVLQPDRSGFFVSDAATGTVLDVGLDGTVATFAPVPGHAVLTGMAWGPDGDLHVASFGQLPHPLGSGAVVAIDDAGTSRVVVDEVTMAIDVAFDEAGGMFILEYANPPDEPTGVDAYRDGTGRLLYLPSVPSDDSPTVLLDDLNRPTALAVNGDDVLISLASGVQAPGAGSLARYSLVRLLEDAER